METEEGHGYLQNVPLKYRNILLNINYLIIVNIVNSRLLREKRCSIERKKDSLGDTTTNMWVRRLSWSVAYLFADVLKV